MPTDLAIYELDLDIPVLQYRHTLLDKVIPNNLNASATRAISFVANLRHIFLNALHTCN